MSTVIKTILLIILLGVIGYVGLSVWSCACGGPSLIGGDTVKSNMPCKEDATHSFQIKNTGGLILASDYEQHGTTVGSRIFVLRGFWELRGNKFSFVAGDIVLDESIFGKITVEKRTKD